MKPRHAPDKMSAKSNRQAAFQKVSFARLESLTDAQLRSIAGSHHNGKPGDKERLFEELAIMRGTRLAKERHGHAG